VRGLVVLLACGTGLTVAGLYYNQPLLDGLAHELHATRGEIGLIPMLTQLGYALGIVAFAPLGDRLDRRRVILTKCAVLAVVLGLAAIAPTWPLLAAASLAIGIAATGAQDMVPAAAAIAPPAQRGQIVGSVMSGLLLGILLSRLASGAIADALGWRAVFGIGGGAVAAFTLLAAAKLPAIPPTVSSSYGALLKSMWTLVRTLPALRRAALSQALLSVAFSAFWSTLAVELAADYGLGATAAGLFGLAGAAGALAAPLAGAFADKRGPLMVVKLGCVLVMSSFALMGLVPSLATLIIGAVVFDLGTQASLISHQSVIYFKVSKP